MNSQIKVGIVGAAGYAAGELIRLLLNHPETEIVFANSETYAGCMLAEVHSGLYGETNLCFTDELPFEQVDVVFLCLENGQSAVFLEEHYVPADVRIIDLTRDFRLASEDNEYIYGLPELNSLALRGARYVANPGSFASCVQLALLPLAAEGLLDGDVMVNAIAGSMGDGVESGGVGHAPWHMGNVSLYKPFEHPDVSEVVQSLKKLQPTFDAALDFISYHSDFPRGIFVTAVVHCDLEESEVAALYKNFYAEAPFTHYVEDAIDLKQVLNTNKCLVHVERHSDKLLITACIDNLLKGQSGQAVQNMNLMFELEETAGLRLKPLAF